MMRRSFVIISGFMLLAGCESKPKYSFEIANDPSKSGNAVAELNNKSSTTASWSKKFRDQLTQDCINKVSKTVSAAEASRYCSCLTEKVEVKYPDEDEVQSNLSQEDIENMKPDCLALTSVQNNRPANNKEGWSIEDQRGWMDNCTPGAGKTLGTSAANKYCDCMMRKLMKEYPVAKDIGSVPQTHLNALASGCLGK
jgi:outer membrane murein-binding lipoprotein Lpp